MTFLRISLLFSSAIVLAACSSTPPVSLPDRASACPDPRPQMCTMDYRPAYGYDQHGRLLGVYGNACGACGDDEVQYTLPKHFHAHSNDAPEDID